jgi:hypothetical protein
LDAETLPFSLTLFHGVGRSRAGEDADFCMFGLWNRQKIHGETTAKNRALRMTKKQAAATEDG